MAPPQPACPARAPPINTGARAQPPATPGPHHAQVWDTETLGFLDRVFDRSGLGADATYLPPAIHPKFVLEEGRLPRTDLKSAAEEARMVRGGRAAGAPTCQALQLRALARSALGSSLGCG
jgi:hypothetical protein